MGRPAVLLRTRADAPFGHRLAQLGLRSGATLTPVQRTPGGGIVVAAGEVRLALDAASMAALQVRTPVEAAPVDEVA